ncbi:MAG: hypothetical protein KGL18_15590 [Burkholderiales bacterium]|nr:hypothetical protein [Burkholderiales bacterium]MDE1927172.1 hypothetical protein [Burkholderiales bacterium]MDE2157813.1 hypothetical protein [Burkholderiales bacterium]MDE2504385.1 hypothetical protein [Burkholderiales bacterium]
MDDLRELGDLRPPPRQASPWVLWLMAAVVLVGGSLLIGSGPGPRQQAASGSAAGPRASQAAEPASRSRT